MDVRKVLNQMELPVSDEYVFVKQMFFNRIADIEKQLADVVTKLTAIDEIV